MKHVYQVSTNKTKGKELELLLAILPNNNGSLYGDLKRICETDLGIISQCCLTKHVFKISKQYLANVSTRLFLMEDIAITCMRSQLMKYNIKKKAKKLVAFLADPDVERLKKEADNLIPLGYADMAINNTND